MTRPLKEGNKAPAFKLPKRGGGSLSLKELQGKNVVLYFYPRDNTPGCTTEACDFRDAKKKLDKLNAVAVGVSRDSVESHDKFAAKYDLNFPLLTDAEGTVLEKYGAWGEKNLYGKKSMGILRTTVMIGPDGRVKRIFSKVRAKGHVEQVLQALKDDEG